MWTTAPCARRWVARVGPGVLAPCNAACAERFTREVVGTLFLPALFLSAISRRTAPTAGPAHC